MKLEAADTLAWLARATVQRHQAPQMLTLDQPWQTEVRDFLMTLSGLCDGRC